MEIDAGGPSVPGLLAEAKAAARRGDDHQAVLRYSKALVTSNPPARSKQMQLEGLLGRAHSLIRLGQYVDAVSDLNTCISQFPGSSHSADVYWCRGEAYRLQGILCRAIPDFEMALRENPRFVDAYVSRGLAFFESKNYNKAAHDFSGAIRLDSQCFDAFLYRARCLLAQAKPDFCGAALDLDRALHIRPLHGQCLIERSRVALRLGSVDDAFRRYQKAVDIESSLEDQELLQRIQFSLQHRSRHVLKKRKSCDDSIVDIETPAVRRQRSSPESIPIICDMSAEGGVIEGSNSSGGGFHTGKENLVTTGMHIE